MKFAPQRNQRVHVQQLGDPVLVKLRNVGRLLASQALEESQVKGGIVVAEALAAVLNGAYAHFDVRIFLLKASDQLLQQGGALSALGVPEVDGGLGLGPAAQGQQ